MSAETGWGCLGAMWWLLACQLLAVSQRCTLGGRRETVCRAAAGGLGGWWPSAGGGTGGLKIFNCGCYALVMLARRVACRSHVLSRLAGGVSAAGLAEWSRRSWCRWVRDDRGVPGHSGPLPSWEELSEAQRCILYEGMHGATLAMVLNAWVARVSNDDAPYWNRKGSYVAPLARAARSLVDLGLVEVWEERAEVGEGGLMPHDLAAEAVSDPENWWRYDPGGNWDPGEDLTRYAGLEAANTEPMTTIYTLITVKAALDLGLVRCPW